MACDDGLVGDGFVSISGQSAAHIAELPMVPKRDAQSGPAIVNFAVNDKLQPQISILNALTMAGPRAKVGILAADAVENLLRQKRQTNGEIAFGSDSGAGRQSGGSRKKIAAAVQTSAGDQVVSVAISGCIERYH